MCTHLHNLHRHPAAKVLQKPPFVVLRDASATRKLECMETIDLQARAAQRLDAERTRRLDAITTLGATAERANSLRAELAEVEKSHTDQYAKALRLGWTDTDLKELGIPLPAKRPNGRPKSSKTTSS